MGKSCMGCAYSTEANEPDWGSLRLLGRAESPSSACLKMQTLLSLDPETEDAEALSGIAERCDLYLSESDEIAGEARAAATVDMEDAVAQVRVAYPTESTDGTPGKAYGACAECPFFVGAAALDEIGMPIPFSDQRTMTYYCAARGTLVGGVHEMDMVRTARECGVEKQDWDVAMADRPEWQLTLLEQAKPLRHLEAAYRGYLGPVPEEMEEDVQETTEAEAEAEAEAELPEGATGWVEFRSDDGQTVVRLPQFDPGSFSEAERDKIPVAGSEGSPELFSDHSNLGYRIAVAWSLGETPALHGPSGTGKTSILQWMAYRLGLPFERVSITASSSVDDLAGYMELRDGQTVFEQGRIPRAWAKPCVLALDEPNAGPPEVWQMIRPMTDSAKQLVLDANHGQVIARHPYSFLGMAMNPAWDHRNSGVSTLADADGSRLLHMFVGYPDPKVERGIIEGHCKSIGAQVEPEELDALMRIAASLRRLSEAGTLQVSWGIRQQVKVAKLLRYVPFAEAYRLAAADSLEPAQQRMILDEVNSETAALGTGKTKTRGRARGARRANG